METIKCPVCEHELSEEEVKFKVCCECGNILNINKGNAKVYTAKLKQIPLTSFSKWIRFLNTLMMVFGILCAIACIIIIAPLFNAQGEANANNIIATISIVLLYIISMTLYQFAIKVAKDVFILRVKEQLNNK